MNRISMNPFLRGALALDAVASGAMGIALTVAPAALGGLFNLPVALLGYVGVFLLAYAAFVAVLAIQNRPPAPLVWLVIVGNAGWVAGSLLFLASGVVTPSVLGYAFVIVQAIAVGVFAELQYIGARRAPAVAAS